MTSLGRGADWEQLLGVDPDYPGLKFALGRVLIQTGDRGRGANLLKEQERSKAVEDEYNRLVLAAGAMSETASGHRALARWCQAHGRDARARLEWEFVLELAPNDVEANRALLVLNS